MTPNKERILLIGGTSDAPCVAQELLDQGHWVLHSRFSTSVTLPMPESPNLQERFGPLDCNGFVHLVQVNTISRIIDCAHPFAERVHQEVALAAEATGIPLQRMDRAPLKSSLGSHVYTVDSHHRAADLCREFGGNVLATIGSRNIDIYQKRLSSNTQQLFARILDDQDSYDACVRCGIPPQRIITGRGPFSVEQNKEHLKWSNASILVTKESGIQGGVLEKIEASKALGCRIILISRPKMRN